MHQTYGPWGTSERMDEGSDQGENGEYKKRKEKKRNIEHKIKERREGKIK